jgi:hypothetical protein
MGRPTSTFLRDLETAVAAELRDESHRRLGASLRVGVLVASGFGPKAAREKLGISISEYKDAQALLERAAVRMPAGADYVGDATGASTALTSQEPST